MEEPREESESVRDCRDPVIEAGSGKGLGLSSKTETLEIEDPNPVEVAELGVSDEKQDTVDVEEDKTVGSDDVKRAVGITVPEAEMKCEGDTGTTEVNLNDETSKLEVENKNGVSHETAGEEGTVSSSVNEVSDAKEICEVEVNDGASDAKQNAETVKSQLKSADGETLSVVHSEQEKESANKSEEDNKEMDTDSKQENEENAALHEQGNLGHETKDAQVSEESTQLSKEEANEENQKEESGEAMEIDCAAEEQVERDIKVGSGLDDACNESAVASMVQTQDVPIAEAETNESNVGKEMEIDEPKDLLIHMTSDPTGTTISADSAIPNSPTEDAAPGEVAPLDHNALFDPTSDITNYIDFSSVPSWSGNVQDVKNKTRNVSLKEDKKATDMAEEGATMGIKIESNEARVASGADSPAAAAATDSLQEDKDNECLDKKTADQQDTMREEDGITHEAPSIDPNQKENTEIEENPISSDFAVNEMGSEIKANGVKRQADALSEDSTGEGRKTVSFAKVSSAPTPSFKIGACIARAASQMAGSPSVLKGSNFSDETLAVESFVSQLHCAATDPVKANIVSDLAVGFFIDFRNSSASQQPTPENVSSKRARLSNSNAGGTEAFEFEEMGDPYWTDRVVHNGGEEQTPPTEKGNYQIVPVELKPAQVQKTRRPYKRRQSQISSHSASKKPEEFDENAPAELIMNFSETDIIPPEKSLSKMFKHFGPIVESQTEVDREKHRARVVFKKGADAEVAHDSTGRFNIFGTKVVKYELNHTITETFKVQPYVVSLGEEDAALRPPP